MEVIMRKKDTGEVILKSDVLLSPLERQSLNANESKKYQYKLTTSDGKVIKGYSNKMDINHENRTIELDYMTLTDCKFE